MTNKILFEVYILKYKFISRFSFVGWPTLRSRFAYLNTNAKYKFLTSRVLIFVSVSFATFSEKSLRTFMNTR